MVISAMLILAVITTGFAAFTVQDLKASQATYEDTEAYYLAESGIDYGVFLVKHGMTIYPAPPVNSSGSQYQWVDGLDGYKYELRNFTPPTYLPLMGPGTSLPPPGRRTSPSATLSSTSSALYDAAWPITHPTLGDQTGTSNDLPGSIINIMMPNSTTPGGQEFVVVDDIAYANSSNWMTNVRECGSFHLSAYPVTIPTTDGPPVLDITAVGYVRQIPADVTTTQIAAYQNTNTTGDQAVQSWPVLAQRTVHALIVPNVVNHRVQVQEYNEEYR